MSPSDPSELVWTTTSTASNGVAERLLVSPARTHAKQTRDDQRIRRQQSGRKTDSLEHKPKHRRAGSELRELCEPNVLERSKYQVHNTGPLSSPSALSRKTTAATSPMVTIHVFDEARRLKRDFKCPLNKLIEEMRYFVDYLSQNHGPTLEISVRCDFTVFSWLLRYVKNEERPPLTIASCLPILISSAFLKMDNLVQEVATFVADNIRQVSGLSVDLSCLSKGLLSQLAVLVHEKVIEDLFSRCQSRDEDAKDMAKSAPDTAGADTTRVAGAELQARRTLAEHLFKFRLEAFLLQKHDWIQRCARCHEVLSVDGIAQVPCPVGQFSIDIHGEILSKHVPLSGWSVYKYIQTLRAQGQSWRHIFWHLWARIHVLECATCKSKFVPAAAGGCRFHARAAEFPQGSNRGRHACCGGGARRVTLGQQRGLEGCQSRPHALGSGALLPTAVAAVLSQHAALAAPVSVSVSVSVSVRELLLQHLPLLERAGRRGAAAEGADAVAARGSGAADVLRQPSSTGDSAAPSADGEEDWSSSSETEREMDGAAPSSALLFGAAPRALPAPLSWGCRGAQAPPPAPLPSGAACSSSRQLRAGRQLQQRCQDTACMRTIIDTIMDARKWGQSSANIGV